MSDYLTPEQMKKFEKDMTLRVLYKTVPCELSDVGALCKSLSALQKSILSVAKSDGYKTRGKGAMRVAIRDINVFPTANGGLAYEFILWAMPPGIKISKTRWKTDEEMQEEVDDWKRRRAEDEAQPGEKDAQ